MSHQASHSQPLLKISLLGVYCSVWSLYMVGIFYFSSEVLWETVTSFKLFALSKNINTKNQETECSVSFLWDRQWKNGEGRQRRCSIADFQQETNPQASHYLVANEPEEQPVSYNCYVKDEPKSGTLNQLQTGRLNWWQQALFQLVITF